MLEYLCIFITDDGKVLDSEWYCAPGLTDAHSIAQSRCGSRPHEKGYELVINGHSVGIWGKPYVGRDRRA